MPFFRTTPETAALDLSPQGTDLLQQIQGRSPAEQRQFLLDQARTLDHNDPRAKQILTKYAKTESPPIPDTFNTGEAVAYALVQGFTEAKRLPE